MPQTRFGLGRRAGMALGQHLQGIGASHREQARVENGAGRGLHRRPGGRAVTASAAPRDVGVVRRPVLGVAVRTLGGDADEGLVRQTTIDVPDVGIPVGIAAGPSGDLTDAPLVDRLQIELQASFDQRESLEQELLEVRQQVDEQFGELTQLRAQLADAVVLASVTIEERAVIGERDLVEIVVIETP